MQGIRHIGWGHSAPSQVAKRRAAKLIPAKPATQSTDSETDVLYRELTGRDYRGRTRAQWDNGETPTKVDRAQFNYGRCLPWMNYRKGHDGKKPAEYLRTEYILYSVQRRAAILSDAVWNLEMALKAVRDADNETEFQNALTKLRAARAANDVLGIDGTYNQANMPGDPAEPEGENI